MPAKMTIELRDLHFQAFHGLYEEERKTGNEFRVGLLAEYIPTEEVITSINDTVNYADLFNIIKEAMKSPVNLLETLAMDMAKTIHERFPQVIKIKISVYKLYPPIATFNGEVGVSYEQEY
jgi:7,8-dihydroneopterin aldolase/epimerase/oxygenase